MKNDLPYFSHYSTTHNMPKIQALMAEFGMAGYGRYWILCEKIASSPEAALDISNRAVKLAVARSLELCADEFDNFINFLSDSDIGLVKFENGIITADQLTESYNHVSKKRQHDRSVYHSEDIPTSDLQIPSSEMSISSTKNIQSKVNKSKVNKISSSTTVDGETTTTTIFINLCKYFEYSLDLKTAQKISTGIDPAWLSGAFTYPEYIAEAIQENYADKPQEQRRKLFRALLTADDRKSDFPAWRESKTAKAATQEKRRQQEAVTAAEQKRIEQARADKPKKCDHCGATLAVDGERGTCPACGWDYIFNKGKAAWEFSEPRDLVAEFRELCSARPTQSREDS